MKQFARFACLGLFGIIVLGLSLPAYDNSPSNNVIIPEVIWASASGGGTWVTGLQVTAKFSGTQIGVLFNTGSVQRFVTLATTTADSQTKKYANILSTMQSLDPDFTYFGKVGALDVYSQTDAYPLWAQAMTTNGNYGKTYPGLGWTDGNTANVDRTMAIPNIQQSPTFRTFVGFWNGIAGGYAMTVEFSVMSPDSATVLGSSFTKTFASWEFKAFDPFAEAGITANVTNAWLYISPVTSGRTGPNSRGLICFGSTANNYSNDTYALIAVPLN